MSCTWLSLTWRHNVSFGSHAFRLFAPQVIVPFLFIFVKLKHSTPSDVIVKVITFSLTILPLPSALPQCSLIFLWNFGDINCYLLTDLLLRLKVTACNNTSFPPVIISAKQAYSRHTSVAVWPMSFRTDMAAAWLMSVYEIPFTLAILSPTLQIRTHRHTDYVLELKNVML